MTLTTPLKESRKNEGVRRSDAFDLMDYTAQNIAEQLTLIAQVCVRVCVCLGVYMYVGGKDL